jgi:putative NIF3 family GTP cyclohydrolase 1 type 2
MTKSTSTVKPLTILERAKAIGQDIVNLQISAVNTFSLTETLQGKADELRTEGVKFGKSVKTCTWRQGIADSITGLCTEKTAQKTCMNYVTSFVKAVNDGTPFSLSDSKGKAKGKGKGKGKTEAIDAVIAKLFSHGEFASWCEKIQTSFLAKHDNDEKPTINGVVRDYLESEGYEITE